MITFESIPEPCFELLEFVHAYGEPIPYRELPKKFRNVGLQKVCSQRKLIELVLWYTSTEPRIQHLPGNIVVVGSPRGWLPYSRMGRDSLEDAIRCDAQCQDRNEWLHVRLTKVGDLAIEEWKLRQGKAPANSRQGHPNDSLSERMEEALARLRPSLQKAYLQRQYAQNHGAGIEPDREGDKAAHAWLDLHGDEDGNKPVKIGTWLRYLRASGSELGENNPRREKTFGRSIARRKQL